VDVIFLHIRPREAPGAGSFTEKTPGVQAARFR